MSIYKSEGSHLNINLCIRKQIVVNEIDTTLRQGNLKLRHYSGEMYSVSGNRAVNVRPCQMDWVHPVVARARVNSVFNSLDKYILLFAPSAVVALARVNSARDPWY